MVRAQVPIWKKEIYEGSAGEWKENKESAVPTVAQLRANAERRGRGMAIAAAVAAVALVVGTTSRLSR